MGAQLSRVKLAGGATQALRKMSVLQTQFPFANPAMTRWRTSALQRRLREWPLRQAFLAKTIPSSLTLSLKR